MPTQLAEFDQLRRRIGRIQGQLERLKVQLERSLGEERVPTTAFDALLCRVGEELWALPLEVVDEVVLRPALLPLPEAPPWIPGLLDLRGQSLAIIDLPARVVRQARNAELTDLVVVCNVENQRVGLIVEEVLEVQRLAPAALQEAGLDGTRPPYVTGVVGVEGKLILLIGLRRLLLLSDLPESTE